MGFGSNSSEFSVPDAQFPKCGFVYNMGQSQTPIICLSSSRQQSGSDRCPVHGLESSSCICFSSFYSDSCCSGKNPTTSVQNSYNSSVLATTTLVLRTSSAFSVSPDSSATKFHVTIKTAFLLALATAKRCSEIHALAMDSHHLRFNQSDGSVSLILKTGFLAKNQLPSVKPDPIIVPSLARICKREHLDRFLCPVRSLKFCLKMTSSYRQNRTRLFLPIKGNQDISKDTISRWISYTIKLAYRKLIKETFLSLKSRLMKLGLFRLPGLSLIRFLLMISFKQRFGIDHQHLLGSISGTCLSRQKIYRIWAPLWWPKKWWGPNRIQLRKPKQRRQPPTPAVILERYLIYINYVILDLLLDIS